MSKRSRFGAKMPYGSRQRSGYKKYVKASPRAFVPGRDRTGGYYGRFSGPGGEMKFKDTDVSDAVVTATMVINQILVIAQGNTESERIGRKLTIKKIHVKGQVKLASQTAANATANTVIMMLVQDTQTNGAAFTATDLVETDDYKSFRNLAQSSRFKILYKKTITLNAQGGVATGAAYAFGEPVRAINCNVNCSVPIEYDNSLDTGVIATVRSNNIYWVTQASAGTASIDANCRVRYSDN